MVLEHGDSVFYETNNEKAWLCPVKVQGAQKNWAGVSANGDLNKIPKSNIQLHQKHIEQDAQLIQTNTEKDKDHTKEKEHEGDQMR